MKLTVTFILVAFGSMLASAAEPAVVSSVTSSVATSSANAAVSKIAVPTPSAPVQPAPTAADKTKITIPPPKPPVAPTHNIRPPYNHWFGPGRKPFRPPPRPYGYPPFRPMPYLRGGQQQLSGAPSNQGALREKRSPTMICLQLGGCGGSNNWWRLRRPAQKRAPIIAPQPFVCAGLNCGGVRPFPYRRPISWPTFKARPAQKRSPIISPYPFACKGLNCGGGRPWPIFKPRPAQKRSPIIRPYPFACLGLNCGGGAFTPFRRPAQKRAAILPAKWKINPLGCAGPDCNGAFAPAYPKMPVRFPHRRPAQKRAPIVAPSQNVCLGLNCSGGRPFPYRRPFSWPVFKTQGRVNARSAEAEPEPFWCNRSNGVGCSSGRKNSIIPPIFF